MSDIASARLAVNQQRYKEAYEVLYSLRFQDISLQEQREYWSIFYIVLQKLNSLDTNWEFYQTFNSEIPVKIRFSLLKDFSTVPQKWEDALFLKGWWETLIELGNISEAKKVAITYIEHLLERKNFTQGLVFIKIFKDNYKVEGIVEVYAIQFLLQQENYQAIDETLKDKKTSLASMLFNHFYYGEGDYWKKSQYLFEIILEEFYLYSEATDFEAGELREFVNLLYEYLVFFPNESFGVLYLLKYALISKNRSYVYKVKEVALGHQERFCTNFDYEKDILAILKALDSMSLIDSEDKTILANEFDFATDLIHGKLIRENMIKRLEKDIIFLSKVGNEKQLEEVRAKLRVLDKNNTLFFLGDDSTATSIFFQDVQSPIEEQNLNSLYHDIDQKHALAIKRSLIAMSNEEHYVAYRDYFTMLHMLSDSKLVLFYIEFLEGIAPKDDNEFINELLYLKILYFKEALDINRALSVAEQLLSSPYLQYELELEVIYQQGELCFKHRYWEDAKRYFSKVHSVSPDYRLVKHRLWILNEK